MLRLQVGDLLLERGAAGQRLAGEVLAAERERLAALVLQLGGLPCNWFSCSSRRLREVATSATPRRTFCSSSSCFWYE